MRSDNKMANFNYADEIEKLDCPAMFKAGLKFYIENNKVKINSKKDFDNLLKEFKNMNIGA